MPGSIRMKIGLTHLKIDQPGFNTTFDKQARILVRQAARAWLREIITHIPIWTGMALGSVKFAKGPNGFLARYLGVSIPINNTAKSPKWYIHSDGSRVRKIPANGGKYSRYSFADAQKRYTFYYRSDVIHFVLNDFFSSNISHTAPWHAIDQARTAFKLYIADNFERILPKLSDYILYERVESAGGVTVNRT